MIEDPEDEAFAELEARQKAQQKAAWVCPMCFDTSCGQPPGVCETLALRNYVIEEVAAKLEREFTAAFGRDTIHSFAIYIRSMKQ